MDKYQKNVEVRWADLDPNFHMLHSKYYDLAAYARMAFLTENGLSPAFMKQNHVGPILFREECIFRREISFGDVITVNFMVDKISSDFSRCTMIHEIIKNGDTLSAQLTADIAWMDTATRKLTIPPKEIIDTFENAPKSPTFFVFEKEKK